MGLSNKIKQELLFNKKERSVEKIHDIYLKCYERERIYKESLHNFFVKYFDKYKENIDGEFLVRHGNDYYNSKGEGSKFKVDSRDVTIDRILSPEKEIDDVKLFSMIDTLSSLKLVKNNLFDLVSDKVKSEILYDNGEKYSDFKVHLIKNVNMNQLVVINIGEYKYSVGRMLFNSIDDFKLEKFSEFTLC